MSESHKISDNSLVSLQFVENIINGIKNDPTCIISANALHGAQFNSVVTNHESIDKREHVFSHQITDVTAIDQQSAGTCWMCGGMSMCRRSIIKELKLKNDFQLSLNYLMFWDKIERCNYFMTNIITNKNLKFDSTKISKFISSPISDGGYWHTFSDLVEKYGLIPDSIFKRRISSTSTVNLNKLLKYKLREFASLIVSPNTDKSKLCTSTEDIEQLRQEFMAKIIRILVSMIGYPYFPNSTFDWAYTNKSGSKKIIKNLNPLKFYKEYCHINFNDYVPIVNDPRPRHPFNSTYEMISTHYMVKDRSTTKSHILLNLDFDDNVKLIMKQIDAGVPVWFTCDVGKYVNHTYNIMDVDLYNYGLPFDTSFTNMSKSDRLDFSDSYACHAMCIVGYDVEGSETDKTIKLIVDSDSDNSDNSDSINSSNSNSTDNDTDTDMDVSNIISNKRKRHTKSNSKSVKKQKLANIQRVVTKNNMRNYDDDVKRVVKFKVENSWGDIGLTDGFYLMTAEWFKQYGYEIVINKNLLNKKQQIYLNSKPIKLDRRDPLSYPIKPNSDDMIIC